ncbi:hypothetical protein AURDEDRAFT_163719 [Auricularia subglabra TFB-10046 SS5]|nr:hypothetical protein AURDEDRAFT_163719 [Auricularia subglabra TFB-10046 SS5]
MVSTSAAVFSSPASVQELATVLPAALAQQIAADNDLEYLPFEGSGAPRPPSPVIAAHDGLPTHVLINSATPAVHYVYDTPLTFNMPPAGSIAEVLAGIPRHVLEDVMADSGANFGVAAVLAQLPPRASEAGPSRSSCGACSSVEHAPHPRCTGKRRISPYPSSSARAISRASTRSSSSSSSDGPPHLIPADDDFAEPDAPPVRNVVQAEEEVYRRFSALDIDTLEARLRHPAIPNVDFVCVRDLILGEYGRLEIRGDYPAWSTITGAADSFSAIEAVETLARQVLRAEPRFHMDAEPPLGGLVFDFLKDLDTVLALMNSCRSNQAAQHIFDALRSRISLSFRRVGLLFDSGDYLDENTGLLARDIPPPSQQPIRHLLGRDVVNPLRNVIRYLEAVSDLVEQSSDPRSRYE